MDIGVTSLKISAKGQVTLNKRLLAYLGVGPGELVELNMLPGNRLRLARVTPKKEMSALVGLLKPRESAPVTDAEIEDGIAQGAVDAYLRAEGKDSDRADQAA